MGTRVGISAVVITKNEERSLDRCLSSLAFADELIVLDSFSTDRTPEIARKYTKRFSQREFTGFSDQKNAAMALATEEWLLFVDADESISEELASEILETVRSGRYDAYKIPRLTYFVGRPIRHCGWYPDYILRLGRRDRLSIPDRLVHETLVVDGESGKLNNPILHYSYHSITDFFRKTEHYNLAAAKQKMDEGYRFRLSDLLLAPPFTFIKSYIQKLGFLDGMHGLVLCILMTCSLTFRYAILWEMCRERDRNK